ncbi:MAG: MFS transporter [Actinobacteria bacterium]|nr:MAG: MFS transporter [Actinomycetota bacterium]
MRPRIPSLLRRNANFRRYFIGQSVSLLGDQVSIIALPLTAVLALHATAAQMGALTTAYLLPNLLLSLHAGVWVDRSGRRRQVMLAADVARGLLTVTIPIAFALGHLTWPQLYAVAFLLGCASVFFYVSYGGFFQTIVEREDYIEANALLNGSRGFSFLGGTSLGGALVQLLRGPYALGLDAVSFLWSALFLRKIDAPDPPGAPRETGGIGTGLRWIRHNPVMRAELLGVATINLFNFVYWALFLLYASRYLHVGPATIGLVIGVAAAGTLAAAALTGRIARAIGVGPAFLIGCFLFPAPLLLVPAARGPHWLVIAFLFTAEFISGLGLMLLDILAGVIQGGLIPAPVRSRVSGAFMVVNYGVRPLGTSVAGVLGSTIGVHNTIWIGAGGALLGMAFLLPSPIRHLHDVPEAAEI